MKKLLIAIMVVSIGTAFQCREDNTDTTLDLVFEATYNDSILEYGKEYTEVNGDRFTITRSDFFMSDVRLVEDNGSEFELLEVAQIDFENAPGGTKVSISGVPSRDYESIKFNLGLTPAQNKTEPTDYDATNPLSGSGYYWTAWDSYIFTKTEGKAEDEDGNLTRGWIFHTGKDELMREVTIPLDVFISESENNEIRIGLEHSGLFVKDGEAVPLGITHDPSDLEVLGTFIDRMVAGFSLK